MHCCLCTWSGSHFLESLLSLGWEITSFSPARDSEAFFSSVQSFSHVRLVSTPFQFQFSLSVVSDSMNCSIPGFPVHHQLPELTQSHVPWIGNAIQPSHPLSSPYPPAFNLSQHQGLFQWVSSLHKVAKVLQFQLRHQSFQWLFKTDFL